ncbi:hypothetical protein [Ereboglobus luteus]|nr:hypothetical protein [Ereboglobus luteus]
MRTMNKNESRHGFYGLVHVNRKLGNGMAQGCVAAVMAIRGNLAVQDVPVPELQEKLKARGQRLRIEEAPTRTGAKQSKAKG